MMFSAALLSIAVVAMGQFAVYYWRAVFTGMASLPISSRVLEAAQVQEESLCGNDFAKFSPIMAGWAEKERTLCARIAAVHIDRRLEANLVQAASIRSL